MRLLVLIHGRRALAEADVELNSAQKFERLFAGAYIQFAILLGASSAYVFALDEPRFHLLMSCLIVGYGAGVAAGIGLRPWIALPSMLVAIVPAIVTMAFYWDAIYWITASMTTAMLIGGAYSILDRHGTTVEGIARRLTFEMLARQDALTGLPNRLALREWFEHAIASGRSGQLIAVHCLDLDDFKPVNDVLGHPAGDSLLKEVATRMKSILRPTDIAARLGGDEFVVIQRDVSNEHEAEKLGQRLREIISQPHSIQGHTVRVSACVGYIVCDPAGTNLDDLLGLSDEALYAAKNSSSGLAYNAVGVACEPRLVA